MKFLALLAAACVSAIAVVPAQAVVLTFTGNHASVDGPASTSGTTTGTYTDIFTFDTSALSAISGSLTTHALNDLNGNTVEDMDFLSITLDDLAFANHNSSDANEEFALPSSTLAAGSHTLTVNYRIDTASSANAAAYSGDLYLAPASVPEPASWMMFLGGFGLIGFTLRSKRALAMHRI